MPALNPVAIPGDPVVVILPFSVVGMEDGSCGVLVGPLVLVVGVTVDFVVFNIVTSLVELLGVVVEFTVVSTVVVEPLVVGTAVGAAECVIPVGSEEVSAGVGTGGNVGNGGRVPQFGGHCERTTDTSAKRLQTRKHILKICLKVKYESIE